MSRGDSAQTMTKLTINRPESLKQNLEAELLHRKQGR